MHTYENSLENGRILLEIPSGAGKFKIYVILNYHALHFLFPSKIKDLEFQTILLSYFIVPTYFHTYSGAYYISNIYLPFTKNMHFLLKGQNYYLHKREFPLPLSFFFEIFNLHSYIYF